jgi:hypothetical protein
VLDDYPFATMIDNLPQARPHFGLGQADVVYEAPAEGGIPRLMPVFLSAGVDVSRIGPVRSARHYFVQLASEFGTALVHIGASPQGYSALAASGLVSIDEDRGSPIFTRDPRRRSPHNAFVSMASVRDELAQRGGPIQATQGPLRFGAFTPGDQPATSIRIDYPGMQHYSLAYDYQAETHQYARSMDGQPHVDGESGEQYTATSIVVEFVPVVDIPNDPAFRVDVALVGSGNGVLIADGTQVALQWTRASEGEATRYTRVDGAPFELPNGQVWVQIVPLETRVEILG